ncbi:MAG: hypothetical protein KAH56_09315 [Candidatus Krumholzibacteria bacterium]|nr:hypothetical protein [Candidatus Krumholzibacteria bacterium]
MEQDGSGDFSDIQDAVDVAATGDTILIGPGNYNQLHEIQIPAWGVPTKVVVSVDVEGLVFIGAGRDQVIVGPDEFDPTDMSMMAGPMGFFGGYLAQAWSVEGITIHNMYFGIYTYGRLALISCRSQDLYGTGIITFASQGLISDNCIFQNNRDGGIGGIGPATGFSIVNSEFRNSQLYFQNCQDISISQCSHFGDYSQAGMSGISFDYSSGTIRSCTGEGFGGSALGAMGHSNMQVLDCNFQSFGGGVVATEESVVVVENSIISGGQFSTFSLYSGAQVTVNGSHIIRTNGNYVKCQHFTGAPMALDFAHNFWGTSDLDTIAAYIWDGNDDPGLSVIIDYDPISEVPLPVEGQEKSFGGLKAMFR